MIDIYSPIYKGTSETSIGAQAAKRDWLAIGLAAAIIGLLLPALLMTGLYIGERHLAETAIYTA